MAACPRIQLVGLPFTLSVLTGCVGTKCLEPVGRVIQVASFRGFDSNGDVMLEDGRRLRLAGVRILGDDETGEPGLLQAIEPIIKKNGRDVRVATDSESGDAIVYYCQNISYQEAYWAHIAVTKALRPARFVSINELLIMMGAARFDEQISPVDSLLGSTLAAAQRKYDEKFWDKGIPRYQQDLLGGPIHGVYCSSKDGLTPRRNRSDELLRRKKLKEADAVFKVLDPVLADPNLGNDQWRIAADALQHENTFVRRHVTWRFRDSSVSKFPIDIEQMFCVLLLRDSDPCTRARAATALGANGSAECLPALERALDDPSPEVKASAGKAINRLRASRSWLAAK